MLAVLAPAAGTTAILATTLGSGPALTIGKAGVALSANAMVMAVVLLLWDRWRTAGHARRLQQALQTIGEIHAEAPPYPRQTIAPAEAFRDVSRELGISVATQAALAHIDKTILGPLDVDEIARSAIRCLRWIGGVDLVVLVFNEMPSARDALVYTSTSDRPEQVERARIAASPEWLLESQTQSFSNWTGKPQLPGTAAGWYLEHHPDAVRSYFPIPGSRRIRGAVILGRAQDLELREGEMDLVSDLIGRLRIACATVERNRRLKELAHADALTGLPNRHALLATLARTLAEAPQRKTHVAVLFLDLDRFKPVNDTYGHALGDQLLRSAAERIRRSVRESDTVARQGGDEFVVVLGDLESPRDAGGIGRQIVAALSRRFEIDGKEIFVGASVGIAVFPEHGTQPSDLVRKADTAMYWAKAEGRSRLAYFDERMSEESRRRSSLDSELRRALDRGEFVLHFQPLIELRSGRVRAVEALLRWQHPERGLLAPDTFVPFAEESGLIDAIGTWVLHESCHQYRRWRQTGVPIPRVAINVSITQMRRSHFVNTVRSAMSAAAMAPGSLEIEATESVLLQGDTAAYESMRSLAAAGVLFTIDDFGTGYSSFSNLTSVPAQVLKLDRSFLAGAAPDNDRATIVTAMVQMAHALKKEVVAEGVENETQLALLRHLDCDVVQGYLLCRPLPAAAIADFVRRRNVGESDAPEAAQPVPVVPPPMFPPTVPGSPDSDSDDDDDDWSLTVPMV